MFGSVIGRYAAIAALTVCCGRLNADVTLYSQTPNFFAFGGSTSVVTLPITADDFTPASIWRLSGATLQGAWRDAEGPIPPGTTTRDFRIQFYADNGGLPTDPPFQDFSVVATTGNPQSHPDGLTVYDIGVTFPSSLLFASGTHYWFAALDEGSGRSGSAGFFWSGSAEGDADIAQKGNEGWELFQDNLGFSLIGTVVPEPSAGMLAVVAAILGLTCLGVCRRRTRDHRA